MRQFTEADLVKDDDGTERISATPEELRYSPPGWMKQGLQETRSGYGSRLNSGYLIHFAGRAYRIYVTIYSNCGTTWFKMRGRKVIVY